MIIKFIEAAQGSHGPNWGKFMLGRFDHEWFVPSALPEAEDQPLLRGRGWDHDHLLFVDLQTGEGAILRPSPHASVKADLHKHKIWVCPLAEPFLEWLYKQDLSDLATLPDYVELPGAPFLMAGHRREGEGMINVPLELLVEFTGAAEHGMTDEAAVIWTRIAHVAEGQGVDIRALWTAVRIPKVPTEVPTGPHKSPHT